MQNFRPKPSALEGSLMRVNSNFRQIDDLDSESSPVSHRLPKTVELPEDQHVEATKNRRQNDVDRHQSLRSMGKMLGGFSDIVDELKNPLSFEAMRAESSNQDRMMANVTGRASPGTYDLEIKSTARAGKILTNTFPDQDQTPVGVGSLSIAIGDVVHDVPIAPGSHLRGVADAINDAVPGASASIINTGQADEPFALMVRSRDSGESASIRLDSDTTFLETAKQFSGRDLELEFDGITVARTTNTINDLIEGVHLQVNSATPGERIALNVRSDTQQAEDNVRKLVSKFNQIKGFDGETGESSDRVRSGVQSDASVRQVIRELQSAIQDSNLSKLGINTDPKTGQLKLDDLKLKMALTNHYDEVVETFASSGGKTGLAEKLHSVLQRLQSPSHGALGLRIRSLEQRIRRQDREIEQKEQRLESKKNQAQKRLSDVNARIEASTSQLAVLSARLGDKS